MKLRTLRAAYGHARGPARRWTLLTVSSAACRQRGIATGVSPSLLSNQEAFRNSRLARNACPTTGERLRRPLSTYSEKTSTGAVTDDEFEEALSAAWAPIPGEKLPFGASKAPPHRIGIAVSGGVDSMALAVLCQRLQRRKPNRYEFHTIVVDHQAREGSREEASEVVDLLAKQGLNAFIETLDWGPVKRPMQLSNFETVARQLRFRALGERCKVFHLRYLLLAHHEDDQAETVLGRIVSGHTGSGLRAIRSSAPIPECEGLWGISEGPKYGSFATFAQHSPQVQAITTGRVEKRAVRKRAKSLVPIAHRGITVHRPLLHVTKARLIATCQELSVAWKEDTTNQDMSLTSRNAIRSLLASDCLPLALQRSSLLDLARKVTRRMERSKAMGTELFRSSTILKCDLQVGRVEIKLEPGTLDCSQSGDMQESRRLAVEEVVRRMAQILSPYGNISASSVEAIASRLLEPFHSGFTGGGIQWSPVPSAEMSRVETLHWVLSRAMPPMLIPKSKAKLLSCVWTKCATANRTNIQEPDLQMIREEGLDRPKPQPFDSWQLFDGRFWINVTESDYKEIVATFLSPKGLSGFRKLLSAEERKVLDRKLHIHAPTYSRFTLPTLVSGVSGDILAVPSLGFVSRESHDTLKYDICYRRIER